ncbi:hypothetical protein [Streptomyces sp. GSL17-111]|uniref:hypothetical protein n=1 Tax=Streptomyces sp. GSL17-111 TaxID=3121596 RepID=UPI0030F37A28
MTLLRRLPLLVAPLVLVACGSETGDVPDQAELDRRIETMGSAPELVYLTEAEGYTLARQSVGVYGDDGFSASYVSQESGAVFQLTVDHGDLDCAEPAVAEGSSDAEVTCEEDGGLLYRSTPDGHEYARAEDGHVVRVGSARDEATRETLRQAADEAHRAEGAELDEILPPLSDAPAPVERGDLPEHGDGAPQDPPGVSG